MNKSIRYAAVTVAACLASGAVSYAAKESASTASSLVLICCSVFGFLAFCAASED